MPVIARVLTTEVVTTWDSLLTNVLQEMGTPLTTLELGQSPPGDDHSIVVNLLLALNEPDTDLRTHIMRIFKCALPVNCEFIYLVPLGFLQR